VTLNDPERHNGHYIALFILGRALCCIFSTVNTVMGLCLAMKIVDLWRNLYASLLYFVVRVRCSRKESSHSPFTISSPDEFLVTYREYRDGLGPLTKGGPELARPPLNPSLDAL